jgi:hypothetical protein
MRVDDVIADLVYELLRLARDDRNLVVERVVGGLSSRQGVLLVRVWVPDRFYVCK